MKLEQLNYFLAAAKHQHIHKAALEVSISPSAISHSIRALEEEFNQILFTKQGRNIFLTDAGKMLQQQAEALLEQARLIKESLQDEQLALEGSYQIAGTHYFCQSYLVPAWMNLQKQYPKLLASIASLRSAEVVSKVSSGKLDLGLCLSPHVTPDFESQVIKTEDLVITVNKQHPIFQYDSNQRLKHLATYPAAMAQRSQQIQSCEVHPALKQFQITPSIELTFDNYEVAIAAIKKSNLWTLIPESIALQHTKTLSIIKPKTWRAPYEITLIWRKQHNGSLLIESLLKTLKCL